MGHGRQPAHALRPALVVEEGLGPDLLEARGAPRPLAMGSWGARHTGTPDGRQQRCTACTVCLSCVQHSCDPAPAPPHAPGTLRARRTRRCRLVHRSLALALSGPEGPSTPKPRNRAVRAHAADAAGGLVAHAHKSEHGIAWTGLGVCHVCVGGRSPAMDFPAHRPRLLTGPLVLGGTRHGQCALAASIRSADTARQIAMVHELELTLRRWVWGRRRRRSEAPRQRRPRPRQARTPGTACPGAAGVPALLNVRLMPRASAGSCSPCRFGFGRSLARSLGASRSTVSHAHSFSTINILGAPSYARQAPGSPGFDA